MSQTNVVNGKETFVGEKILELKKIEPRTSDAGNKYFMLFFNMCVQFDETNMRNNRFIDVPIHASEDFISENFKGKKPGELVNKMYQIEVELSPKIGTSKDGQKFANFSAELLTIVPVEESL